MIFCSFACVTYLQVVAKTCINSSFVHAFITGEMYRLHWLHVPQRIQFKLCLLMYKALHRMAPDYVRELCRSVSEDDARGSLRSAECGDLIVLREATKFGDRPFAISGPLMWNSLPTTVRNSSTLSNFKSALKSHLFT